MNDDGVVIDVTVNEKLNVLFSFNILKHVIMIVSVLTVPAFLLVTHEKSSKQRS